RIGDEQPLCDRALAAGIRRPVEELTVECHRRRIARLEAGAPTAREPDELLRELVVRQTDAVADTRSVDGDEHDRTVAALADRRASRPGGHHRRGKILEGAEDGLALPHE